MNDVSSPDSRIFSWWTDSYRFLETKSNQAWTGKPIIQQYNTTYDGEEYKLEKFTIHQSSWYFLADNRIETKRKVFTLLNVLSNLGGFIKVIFGSIGIIGTYINV
jgi:hypothetical protein